MAHSTGGKERKGHVIPDLVVDGGWIGSRYGGLKQIDPVGPRGEIVIDYSVYDALRAGFDRIVFIIRKDIEAAFRDKIGRTVESRVDTEYVFQDIDRLPEGFSVPPGRTKPWEPATPCSAARTPSGLRSLRSTPTIFMAERRSRRSPPI